MMAPVSSLSTIPGTALLRRPIRKPSTWLLADNFVSIDIDGSMQTKREFLASLKSTGYHAPSQSVTEQSKVDVYGSSALVLGIFRTQTKDKGRLITRRERFLDTWVNLNGTWRCVASVAVLIPSH
jgi:hypothetical protein